MTSSELQRDLEYFIRSCELSEVPQSFRVVQSVFLCSYELSDPENCELNATTRSHVFQENLQNL